MTKFTVLFFAFLVTWGFIDIPYSYATKNEKCNPQVYFVRGLKDKFVRNLYETIKPSYTKADIGVELHSHWQFEDDKEYINKCAGYATVGGHAATWTCISGTVWWAPWITPFCVIPAVVGQVGGTACAIIMQKSMGNLGKNLAVGLKNRENPIILIGHSWGGDTAYEFVKKYIPFAAKEYNYKPRISLVTLDAVGKLPRDNRPGLESGNWLNVHLGRSDPEGCGSSVLEWARRFNSRVYAWQKYATKNINARAELAQHALDHCSVNRMFALAQKFIEGEIQEECGRQFKVPKWCFMRKGYPSKVCGQDTSR